VKRVLYDTNVLFDVLLRREPYFVASATALDSVGQEKVEGYISGHAVTTLAYLLRRQLGQARSRAVLVDLLSKMRVAPVTDAAIRKALSEPFDDFEDAVSHAAAQEAGVVVIVTRNARDFKRGSIPAVLPEAFRPE